MLKDIVEVRPIALYRVHLRFEDGVEGEVDVAKLIDFSGIFAPLKDRREFVKVRVHPELGTTVWPNGADLDPDIPYAEVTGQPIVMDDPAGRAS
jgi:hypothetical protein